MKERLERVKTHLKENKKVYFTGASCLVAGALGSAILMPKDCMNVRQFQVLTWKSRQSVEVFVEALGDPGNIVQDTTTGIVYASQGQAARELSLDRARITDHLMGRAPHVKGHIFTRLGKATVSE
jgi:hypothetical protein